MSAIVYANSNRLPSDLVEMVAENRTDINTLDTSYQPGSTCIVTEDSSVWMLGVDKIWHEL